MIICVGTCVGIQAALGGDGVFPVASSMLYILLSVLSADEPDSKPAIDLRCGSYCLYVALKAFDYPVGSFAELEAKLGEPSMAGYSLGQLNDAALAYGAHTLGVETTIENLQRRPGRYACLTLIGKSHFILLNDVRDGNVSIIDPPGSASIPLDTFRLRWSRKALLISDQPLLREENLPRAFPWKTMLAFATVAAVVLGTLLLLRRLRRRPQS